MKLQFIFASFLFLLFVSCSNTKPSEQNNEDNYTKLEGTVMGTFFHITYLHPQQRDFSKEIDSIFVAFNASLSTYQANSVISKVNRNEEVEIDPYFIACFNKAREVYEVSEGAFDITVAPIVNAYGFGFTEGKNLSKQHIDSLLQFVGMDKVSIQNGKVVKKFPQMMLDGNAIAPGLCVDIIADFLGRNKCQNYMIEIGGEIITKGKNPKNQAWRIGIDKPIEGTGIEERELQEVVDISDNALATSGNYRKFYEQDGVKYSHSIDPKTGVPVRQNLLSTTIIAHDCATADAYATVCMVIGLEKAKKLLETLPDMEAYFIYADPKGEFKIEMTTGMKKYIHNN